MLTLIYLFIIYVIFHATPIDFEYSTTYIYCLVAGGIVFFIVDIVLWNVTWRR